MATVIFQGSAFSYENPFLIPYASFVLARQRAAETEKKSGLSLVGSIEWINCNQAANRALRKALEWEDQRRPNHAFGYRRGPLDL